MEDGVKNTDSDTQQEKSPKNGNESFPDEADLIWIAKAMKFMVDVKAAYPEVYNEFWVEND